MILCSNPKLQYLAYKDEIDSAIQQVLSEGQYVLGKNVHSFEKEFSEYIGSHHSVSVGSGTDALCLAMRSLGLEPGDEVIAPSHTATLCIALWTRMQYLKRSQKKPKGSLLFIYMGNLPTWTQLGK